MANWEKIMGRKESYELQLKKAMKAAGIYDRKFDFQIKICANSMRVLDRMMDELEVSELYVEKFSRGDVQRDVNPIIASVQKQNTLVTEQLTALGLNFRAKASNIKESVGANDGNALKDFMNNF